MDLLEFIADITDGRAYHVEIRTGNECGDRADDRKTVGIEANAVVLEFCVCISGKCCLFDRRRVKDTEHQSDGLDLILETVIFLQCIEVLFASFEDILRLLSRECHERDVYQILTVGDHGMLLSNESIDLSGSVDDLVIFGGLAVLKDHDGRQYQIIGVEELAVELLMDPCDRIHRFLRICFRCDGCCDDLLCVSSSECGEDARTLLYYQFRAEKSFLGDRLAIADKG